MTGRRPPGVEPQEPEETAPAAPAMAPEALVPTITHLVGQEAHAFNRQAVADRYRLLVTLTGGTAAFLVPAELVGGAGSYALSTTLMVFVVVLGGYYRWQAAVWRLVVIQLQSQRLVILGHATAPVDLVDNDRLFAFFARETRWNLLSVDLLQMLALVVLVLVAAGPGITAWAEAVCGDATALRCMLDQIARP